VPYGKLANEIYLSVRKNLWRAASRILPPHEIEDVVQEAYVRLCQVENPEEIKNPKSYLLRTVRNLALDQVKRAEHRLSVRWDEDPEHGHHAVRVDSDNVYEQSSSSEEFGHFCEAVRQLPPQCRRVFVLKKVYGYTQREIAEELELSESTVEKHVALGVRRCAAYMLDESWRQSGKDGQAGARIG
jgi:RNA polymerase sigma-70 factor (ECF subfamily)